MRLLLLQCLLLAWASAVLSSPRVPAQRRAAPSCIYNKVVSAIRAGSLLQEASSFCSSYIETSTTATVTNVATATVTTVNTLPEAFVTVDQTTYITDTITDEVTSVAVAPPVTTTVTTIIETVTPAPIEKRFNTKLPPWLSKFPATEISSACTCLITSAPVSTLTATVSATTTAIDTLSTQSTGFVTDVITDTVLATVVATTVEPPTTTSTDFATATAYTTLPPPVCEVGHQPVQNPSFETETSFKPASWTLFASYEGFEPVSFDAEGVAYSGSFAMDVNSDPVGADYETISQLLEGVCPGATYEFSAYIGIYTAGLAPSIYSTVSVTLGGVTIFPAESPCPPGLCTLNPENNQGVEYRQITATVVPTSADPELVITVSYNVPNNVQADDTLIDLVTLTLATLPA